MIGMVLSSKASKSSLQCFCSLSAASTQDHYPEARYSSRARKVGCREGLGLRPKVSKFMS